MSRYYQSQNGVAILVKVCHWVFTYREKTIPWFLSIIPIIREICQFNLYLVTHFQSSKCFEGSCKANNWKARKWFTFCRDIMRETKIRVSVLVYGSPFLTHLESSKCFGRSFRANSWKANYWHTSCHDNTRKLKNFFESLFGHIKVHYCSHSTCCKFFGIFRRAKDWKTKKRLKYWRHNMGKSRIFFGWLLFGRFFVAKDLRPSSGLRPSATIMWENLRNIWHGCFVLL